MCMLTVFPMPGLMTEEIEEKLYNGAAFNNDGHGWAVISGGRIITGKNMDARLAIDAFLVAYAKADGPALFHSRWATHGSETLANVHPFPVKKMSNTYVAHNGVLPASAHPLKGDDRSDTRIFADEILPSRFARLDRSGVRAELERWLGGNKIAVLTLNRKLRRQVYIFNQDLGNWSDGVWFSNYDHEGYRFGRHTTTIGRPLWALDDEEWEADYAYYAQPKKEDDEDKPLSRFSIDDRQCDVCRAADAVSGDGVCAQCFGCQGCLEYYRDCECEVGELRRGPRPWWQNMPKPEPAEFSGTATGTSLALDDEPDEAQAGAFAAAEIIGYPERIH